jgi:G6PDH family F420-dependent oxidoreductase
MIAVEPNPELGPAWDKATGASTPARKVGQFPISWDSDTDAAKTRAHEQFRWFANGWKVNAELPSTAGFDAASQFVTPADVAAQIPCGTDVEKIVKSIKPFKDAGFTDVALLQIGADQQQSFLEAAQKELLPALREALG